MHVQCAIFDRANTFNGEIFVFIVFTLNNRKWNNEVYLYSWWTLAWVKLICLLNLNTIKVFVLLPCFRQYIEAYWGVPDIVLRRTWHCIEVYLTLYWGVPDIVLRRTRHCIEAYLTLYWGVPDIVLRRTGHCIEAYRTLYWGVPDIVLRRTRHCIEAYPTLYEANERELAICFGLTFEQLKQIPRE